MVLGLLFRGAISRVGIGLVLNFGLFVLDIFCKLRAKSVKLKVRNLKNF